MERFLGVHQHPEKENQSGYKRMVKFLLSDQTVRVVTAAALLLSKLHLYEVLSNLKEVSERYIDLIHIWRVFHKDPKSNLTLKLDLNIMESHRESLKIKFIPKRKFKYFRLFINSTSRT